jgi:long-chain fatty acid transport protein
MSNNILKRYLPVAILTMTVLTSQAFAGGLYIGEFGQPNMGASRAGANAIAEDASTAWQNPAGIMFLDGKKSMATGLFVNSKLEFDQDSSLSSLPPSVANANGSRPASDGGDAGGSAVGAGFFHANPVNEKWGWGVSLASISAAVIDYEDSQDFTGRYWATEVDLLTVSLLPTLAYRVNEDLSVGFGLPITFGQLDMDVAIPGLASGAPQGLAKINDGEDVVVGVTFSALWQANDSLRLGLIYVGETEYKFDSDLDLTLPPGVSNDSISADVKFTFPQTIRASMTQDISDEVTLLASIAWEDWSQFDEITISTPAVGGALPRDWHDTWHCALGLRWKADRQWTYYTGIAYDTDPTKASKRTADMPIDEQWRLSGGATYEMENGHKVGAALTYADYGKAKISNGGDYPGPGDNSWTVDGDYETNRIIFLGLNYGW